MNFNLEKELKDIIYEKVRSFEAYLQAMRNQILKPEWNLDFFKQAGPKDWSPIGEYKFKGR